MKLLLSSFVAGDRCERDGYTVQRLTDAQALVIDGDRRWIVTG